MSETTKIAWTDATWNPWQGCHRVSPGCLHCYMHTEKRRYGQDPGTVVRSKPPTFNAPLKWAGPARVFTCSWSDFFIEEADAWRDEAWDIIRRTPHLTYQILTKRPERIVECLPPFWGQGWPNVWLGTTVEDWRAKTLRIHHLERVPAAVRFLSCEPLLEGLESLALEGSGIGWVICGGESGPGARPMNADWARELALQCRDADVPFFMKQFGGHPDRRERLEDFPADLRIREFPEVTP